MTNKEQLSTSTQNPKIELPNKTLVGVKPTEKKSEELQKYNNINFVNYLKKTFSIKSS